MMSEQRNIDENDSPQLALQPESDGNSEELAAQPESDESPAQLAAQPENAEQLDPKVMRMGTAPVGKLLFEFGIPAIFSVVLNGLYNIIDSIFLGQAMGTIGLAATQVAAPIMTIALAIAVIAGNGGNSLCAILLGEGKKDEAELCLGNSVFIIFIECIIIAIIATFFIDPILILMGATDVTLPYARTFIQIILYGFIFNNFAFGINNYIRTAGSPYIALFTMVIGTVVCVGLNAWFVLILGWGVVGSASATIIGQAAGAVLVLWYFCFKKNVPFRLRARNLRPKGAMCRRIIALGMAPFLLQVAAAVTQVVSNMLIAHYGALDPIGVDGALASVGVVVKISMFAFFPLIGVAIAAQPVLGFNIGARKFDRVLVALRDAILGGVAIMLFFFAIIHLFPEALIGLFNVAESLMDFSVFMLKVQTACMPFIAVQVIGSNYFQATGQPVKSSILSLTRQFLFLLPALLIMPQLIPVIVPGLSQLMGFCFAFPVADVLSVIFCGIFLIIEIRRLKKLQALELERKSHV